MICFECRCNGDKSTVQDCGTLVTALGWAPYFDEDGKKHSHDPNRRTSGYKCSKGHIWKDMYYKKCWCGKGSQITFKHTLCPKCGSDEIESTTVGFVGPNSQDLNKATCVKCGNTGRVYEWEKDMTQLEELKHEMNKRGLLIWSQKLIDRHTNKNVFEVSLRDFILQFDDRGDYNCAFAFNDNEGLDRMKTSFFQVLEMVKVTQPSETKPRLTGGMWMLEGGGNPGMDNKAI